MFKKPNWLVNLFKSNDTKKTTIHPAKPSVLPLMPPAPIYSRSVNNRTIVSTSPSTQSEDLGTSMLVGGLTGNVLLGTLVGGSLTGAVLGTMIHDNYDNSSSYASSSSSSSSSSYDSYDSSSYSSSSDSSSSSSWD